MSLASWYACAVKDTGELLCWGSGLGNGLWTVPRDGPEPTAGVTDAAQVVADQVLLVRRKSGKITCFGCDKKPVDLPEPADAVDIAASANQVCAVSASGALHCGSYSEGLKRVKDLDDVVDVAVGPAHFCAVRRTGAVVCEGSNYSGQVGSTTLGDQEVRVEVPGVSDAVAVAADGAHTCALRASGKVACWGADRDGRLGDGPEPDDRTKRPPNGTVVEVAGLTDAIALCESATCALRKGGAAVAWGENYRGTLGDGTRVDADSPVAVKGLTGIARIEKGDNIACAITLSGELHCWGDLVKYRPTEVSGLADATVISAGSSSACAVRKGGQLLCWGGSETVKDNLVSSHDTNAPEDRYGIPDAVFVTTAKPSSHIHDACAVRASGEVVCFQDGEPFRPGVADAKEVAIGQSVACALRKNGSVACWGNNEAGQCGPGAEDVARKKAASIPVKDAIAIGAASDAACALRKSGQVVCWGSNEWALLGNGGKDERGVKHPTPSPVSGLSDAVALSMGFTHACAVRKSGQVVCWGSNLDRVASSDKLDLLVPADAKVRDAVGIAAGSKGVCALRKGGAVTCWGVDQQQRGGAVSDESGYSDVPGFSDITSMSLGEHFACALRKSGQALCWGENDHGQLGNGAGPRVPTLFAKP
jgi:alpha-tubulin suppressor-like RCC1 family protein